ncbi:glycogen synthase [Rheinheimera sp.]|uniref:glycogen synthase n=1 Tax=Rheinheimera sp. TaxID=1869214 RepID=UPI00307EA507
MRVLFLCSEYEGLIKTGGLADATRALAVALRGSGVDVRVMLPRYGALYDVALAPDWQSVYFSLAGEAMGCAVRQVAAQEVPLYLLEHHELFGRERPYDDGLHGYPDNARRFSFFCKAALQWCLEQDWKPDLIHGHDWQTGAAACYLKTLYAAALPNCRFVFTVHNGAYQQPLSMAELYANELSWDLPQLRPSLLACGLVHADKLVTVSQGYAAELLEEPAANGLSQLYQQRRQDFSGILNGVDDQIWDPAIDPYLTHHFSPADLTGKMHCKQQLLQHCKLPDTDWPLFVTVSRLTGQKGYDYLIPALEQWLTSAQAYVVLMGTGEPLYVDRLQQLALKYPHHLRFIHGFDEGLSHLLEAAGDFFLMPSLFEPCGLNQLYSLKYGTLPLVRATGGLKDTVQGLEQPLPTGICFNEPKPEAVLQALQQAMALYQQKEKFLQIRKRGMQQKFDWGSAARAYLTLYQQLLN